jgi:hypothetical protein
MQQQIAMWTLQRVSLASLETTTTPSGREARITLALDSK